MILKHGDIWTAYDQASLFLFTSNSIIKSDGSLIMGSGIAAQVRDKHKGIAKRFGSIMVNKGFKSGDIYGMLFDTKTKIAAFQTKTHYSEKSPLELVQYSTDILTELASNIDGEIHMTMPACGHGGRTEEEIFPIITKLPDNVFIWTY